MNVLETFSYNDTPVRTVIKDGEAWFVAADACSILELANPRTTLALLDEDEKGVHTVDTLMWLGCLGSGRVVVVPKPYPSEFRADVLPVARERWRRR
ncbi:BRO-N domain-containing protein [Nesterenkonia ebinurensis]|uniref:BRO-N domain-containing protein n=1 Tax=Nesterenkonia ebinurensis TaxID=2608252 RepID=UPI00123E3B18|nr:BRO family protein [Nesterenkonia ebinurensis]